MIAQNNEKQYHPNRRAHEAPDQTARRNSQQAKDETTEQRSAQPEFRCSPAAFSVTCGIESTSRSRLVAGMQFLKTICRSR